MKIYGYGIYVKFGALSVDDITEELLQWQPDSLPCMVIIHPETDDQVLDFWAQHQGAIRSGAMAVLLITGAALSVVAPSEAPRNYFHSLSYPVDNDNRNDNVTTRFKDLITTVANLSSWPSADEMHARIWELVERRDEVPEHVVAAYLIRIAEHELNATPVDVQKWVGPSFWDEVVTEFNMVAERCGLPDVILPPTREQLRELLRATGRR